MTNWKEIEYQSTPIKNETYIIILGYAYLCTLPTNPIECLNA